MLLTFYRHPVPGMILLYFILAIAATSCTGSHETEYDPQTARARAIRVQNLQNFLPADPASLHEMRLIVDSMSRTKRDANFYGAANVLIDRLFSDGHYTEADSMAASLQSTAIADGDSLAIAMVRRIRGQMYYKLGMKRRALSELEAALPYVSSPLESGETFATAASINEWQRIAGHSREAASRYAALVDSAIALHGDFDPSAHYPVTALSFKAAIALDNGITDKARPLLDSAWSLMKPGLPPRAYEHFYEARSRLRAMTGDTAGALADIDTLLAAHECYPTFYMADLLSRAEILSIAGDFRGSADAFQRYVAFHDSISAAITSDRLKDMADIYGSEMELRDRRLDRLTTTGLAVVAALLLILLVVALRNAAAERRRNVLLVERLREFDRAGNNKFISPDPDTPSPDNCLPIDRLDRHMRLDRPYTNPALGRKEIADYLGITPDDAANLIRNHRGVSVHQYVNSFRIDEVRRLLNEGTTESISEMAERLGLGTARTLQRAFKERYDMTPSQYRAASSLLQQSDSE